MSVDFSDNLKRLMVRQGINPTQLAARAGVGRQSVYNWLNGAHPRPTTATKLASILGVQPVELFYSRAFNVAQLAHVIETIEQMAQARSLELSATKKARLVALVYARVSDGSMLLESEIESLIELAA